MMYYSFSIIPFSIIAYHYHFLIPILSASPSVDDKMLIAFMKGHQETQLSDYSMQKYEAHFGTVFDMRKNWHCDKIAEKFEEYERTKCQKYRKYLDILHEYLFSEYAGIPTVKPKFVFKERIEIEGPLIYAVNCLAKIFLFYFRRQKYEYKLKKLFNEIGFFEPKLLNAERLNYEVKLSINEMILQLAIDTANEWQTNENLDGIMRQKFNKNFEENLEKMFKKADNSPMANQLYYFGDQSTWTDDAVFSEFVKGLATNSEKYFKMANEYSNNLFRRKEKGFIDTSVLYKIEKMKVHLTQQYEAHLGAVYSMRKYWQCSYIMDFLYDEWEDCQRNRKYLHILYEYFFRLYVEGKSTELANQFPAFKPIFFHYFWNVQMKLTAVDKTLYNISEYFWQEAKNKLSYINFNKLVLNNEVELNYEIKVEENWFHKFKQILLEKINAPKNVQKNGKKSLNLSREIEDNLRQEFEQKMKKMYENAQEKAKLEKAIENEKNNEQK